MDANIRDALAGFDALWSRVNAAPEPDGTGLRALMDMAARERERLCALAKRRGAARQRLEHMAAELDGEIRRLGSEYFLLTGETYRPAAACAVPGSPLTALREAYLAAEALSAALNAEAVKLDAEPRRTLETLSAAESRRASELRGLIYRALGANRA